MSIARQDKRVKNERLVSKLKDVFSKLVHKSEERFNLTNETEEPDSKYPVLGWLDAVTKKNTKILLAARIYFNSVADQDTVCKSINSQIQIKRSSRLTTSSLSSQRKHYFLTAKLKRDQVEKQEQAAKLDEADLLDDRTYHLSELNLLKDRGSDRSEKLVPGWVKSFLRGNSLRAAVELNFCRPGSATADQPVQDTALSSPPEYSIIVVGNSIHIEMLSQYTRPGIAISISQTIICQ